MTNKIAVLLMAYGTPRTPAEIEPYYTDIRRGRPPTPEALAELTARYDALGGTSPLAARTEAQRAALIVSAREQRARDLRHLDLVGAAVDLEHLRVAAELLDEVLGHVPVAAEELHGLQRDVHRRLGAVELARRGFGEAHGAALRGELDLAEDEVLHVHAGAKALLEQIAFDDLDVGYGQLGRLEARTQGRTA